MISFQLPLTVGEVCAGTDARLPQAESGKIGRPAAGLTKINSILRREPDQPSGFAGRQFHKAIFRPCRGGGSVSGRGSAMSPPSSPIGPGMIWT